MSWLTRVFGRRDSKEAVEQAQCAHVNLTARWDAAADFGDEERVSGYACSACYETFTREQAQAMGRTPAA